MRHIKHDIIANYNNFCDESRKELLIDEISKAIILYPKAIADVLDNCGIFYQSQSPKDLKSAIEGNNDDLRMLNKLVRLTFLVNKNGGSTYDKHNRNISYRNVMRTGKEFLVGNKEIIKSAVLETKAAMAENGFSEKLGGSVKTYLNMDGDQTTQNDMEEYNEEELDNIEDKKVKPIGHKENYGGALLFYGIFLVLLFRLATSKD